MKQHGLPKPIWNSIRDLDNRSLGLEAGAAFRDKAISSRYFVQRLSLSNRLNFHDGCVNSLSFNAAGNLLASGSDDCEIAIWDWQKVTDKPRLTYDSEHNSNVFQVCLVP